MEMVSVDSKSILRIRRELKFIKKCPEIAEWGISVEVANDNLALLSAQICGPTGTPYEGGTFILEIEIPEKYPFAVPKIIFVTKIWHPNICSTTGKVCFFRWIPSMQIIDILFAVQALLSTAQPDYCIDAAAAKQYRKDPEMFRFTARLWVQLYASNPVLDKMITTLSDLKIYENRINSTYSAPTSSIAQKVDDSTDALMVEQYTKDQNMVQLYASNPELDKMITTLSDLKIYEKGLNITYSASISSIAQKVDDSTAALMAEQYTKDRNMFEFTARHCAQVYAGAAKSGIQSDGGEDAIVSMQNKENTEILNSNPDFDEMKATFKDLGENDNKTDASSSSLSWDLEKATAMLKHLKF